jgi:hypothetical protein
MAPTACAGCAPRTVALLLAVVNAAACGAPVAPPLVSLVPASDSYRVGDTISLTLRNATGTGVGYNFCTLRLERSTQDGWVFASEGFFCLRDLSTLEPGDSATKARPLPQGALPGTYRAVLDVWGVSGIAGGRSEVRSRPFDVR